MSMGEGLETVLNAFWKVVFGKERSPGRDPLILDLDGDGLELTAFSKASSPWFDIDGDEFLERTGWVRPDDGELATLAEHCVLKDFSFAMAERAGQHIPQ